MASSDIAVRVVEAILAQKLAPGARLGEETLATLFGVSRTLVREALMQLSARGFVEVRPRRGWFVVAPSMQEARDAFDARRVIETGMLRNAGRPLQSAIRELKDHVARERAAIESADAPARSFLLGDFHVCLAGCLGNPLLQSILRDLTARTTLMATLYQSTHDAQASCDDHENIVAAIERGDLTTAEALMQTHIGSVQSALNVSGEVDPVDTLRAALEPLSAGTA